jgi:hypothetical protein
MANLSLFYHHFAGIYHLGHGGGRRQPSDNHQTIFGNRQIGQSLAGILPPNPLPIYYRQPGICYRRPRIHQAAVPNRQRIVNPFPVIVNLTAPKSAVSSTIHRKSIDPFPESIDGSGQSTDNRPIFRRNRPIRSLQPLAFPP